MLRAILSATLVSLSLVHAETREWRNSDGSRSIKGDFQKRDETSVSITSADGRAIEIPLDRLHPDDRKWLNAHHPSTPVATPADPEDERALFGILRFGDTRAQTLEKLQKSEIVESTVPDGMLGRTGLNGAFRTKAKVGGQNALLYFDWTEDGKLRDIQLRSDPAEATGYQNTLGPCWSELAELLSVLHGKPLVAAKSLPAAPPAEAQILPTHAWKLEHGGTAQLGPAAEDGQIRIVVHFTTESLIQEQPGATARRP